LGTRRKRRESPFGKNTTGTRNPRKVTSAKKERKSERCIGGNRF